MLQSVVIVGGTNMNNDCRCATTVVVGRALVGQPLLLPRAASSPDLSSPDLSSPDLSSPDLSSPDLGTILSNLTGSTSPC
jgi:hypothetical protein